MADKISADTTIDIKGQICPYTFVRAKLALEKMNRGEVLLILTDHGPAAESIPRSMEGEGQDVLKVEQAGEKEWRIYVRKVREKNKSR